MSVSDLQQNITTVTISTNSNTSTTLSIPAGHSLVAIDTPAALTGSSLTFTASADNGTTFDPLFYEATQYSVQVATSASRFIALDPRVFCAANLIRIVSSATEAADRTIRCIFRAIH